MADLNPSLNIDSSLLQLKPWNSLASVSVANAMVVAFAGLTGSPRWNAVMVATAMRRPSESIFAIKSDVRIPFLGSLGFSDSSDGSAGSIPIASAGRESVSRLMNNRCTGANGTGRAAIEV